MGRDSEHIAWCIIRWILGVVATVGLGLSAWCLTLLIEVQQNVKLQTQALENVTNNMQRLEEQSADHSKILLELSKWQSATQASRFTKLDGEKLKGELDAMCLQIAVADIPGLKERIHRLEDRINKRENPQW